jgi:hypothetical protein
MEHILARSVENLDIERVAAETGNVLMSRQLEIE